MYAIVRTGGKQYRVEPGQAFVVEKLKDAQKGSKIQLNDVLMFSDGEALSVGRPKLSAVLHCTSLGDEKGPKLRTVKYRRRKNYRRTYGHRQEYTRLLFDKLETGN